MRLADIKGANPAKVRKAVNALTPEQCEALLYAWQEWARPEQLPPGWQWSIWLVLAGRGWGKTRTGAEWVREMVRQGAKRIALVAPTSADARDTMVEGESGILAICPERPHYEPSKRRLTFHTGAIATIYSADEPDRLRGPQHELAWCDELAAWRYVREAWDNLMFGLRKGRAQCAITTTPKPITLLRELIEREDVAISKGHTRENLENLAPTFRKQIIERYEGTRIGRQELAAEILDDVPGALWTRKIIEDNRITKLPDLGRIVIGVDPAVTNSETADHTGIIVAGLHGDRGVVLEDASFRGTPAQWAARVDALYEKWEADRVVAESNQGGDMVKHTLHSHNRELPVRLVRATRGKRTRAEPISALYEQGKIQHCGTFPDLEDEMCNWDGDGDSPDRMDAMVWAMTDLMMKGKQRISVAVGGEKIQGARVING